MANEIEIVVTGRSKGIDKIEQDAKKAGDGVAKAFDDGAKKTSTAFTGAARKIAADLDRIEQEAWESGRGMDKAFTTSLKGMRAELDRVEKEAAATGKGLESDLGDALRRVQADSGKAAESIKSDFGNIGDDLKDVFGGLGKAAGLLGAGAVIGQQLWAGLESQWEEGRVGGLLVAQTGAASGAAGRLGDIAGDLFAGHFGESIEDAGAALTALFQNKIIDTSAAEEDIERLAGKVITVGGVMGEEFNAVARSAQQAFRTDLVGSVTEGLDLITHATQEGLNNSGELLDTIDEYGTSFREVGLSGAEAFGLLSQAQQGGARNIDIAADAIKEFGILTQDTASNASRGFQAIGLDGEKMGRMIAAGGKPAREALEQTLNALRAMPPGIERNSAAVDLFGTKAEDMGDALFSMDLDTAARDFGDFGGSVDDAAAAFARALPPMERFGRGWDRMISDMVGSVAELNDVAEGLPEEMQGFEGLDLFSPDQAENVDKGAEALDGAADSANNAADANTNYAATFDQVIEATRAAADGTINLSEASIAAQQALTSAHEAAKEFAGEGLNKTKTGFNLATEAGQEMEGSLNDIADTTWTVVAAMREEGATSQQTEKYIAGQRGELIRAARQMGLSAGAARAYADRLLRIPRTVRTDMELRAAAANAALATVNRRLANIPRHIRTDYYLYTHYRQSGTGSVRNLSPTYGGYGGLAHGGITSSRDMGGGARRPVFPAPMGGVRSSSVQVNDGAGIGEVIRVPDGSTVIPAGTTRAMAERGMLGGGGGAANINVTLSAGAGGDRLTGEFVQALIRKGIVRLTVGPDGKTIKVG